MSLPGLDSDEYSPIGPGESAPDDAGELLPDTPDELPDAPVEPLPDDGEEGGSRSCGQPPEYFHVGDVLLPPWPTVA
jgi:hypothetical protein